MRTFVLLSLLFLSWVSSAHEVRPAFLQLTQLQSDAGIELYEASLRQPQLEGRYLGLQLQTNCASIPVSAGLTDGAVIEVFELRCEESVLESVAIEGLERTLIDTLVSIQMLDGEVMEFLINGDEPAIKLSESTPGVPVYLSIGVEHLVFGFDHVLFVIMLLYFVHKPLDILKVVTSFTVAHSLTLALSAFDLVTLASAPVEAIIAASIVLLAYENLNDRPSLIKQFPALIAFAFGLLHGLGFAGALAEIGLPENSQLMALFLFNVGIELGQLAIITLVLLCLTLMRHRVWFHQVLYQLPLYVTGSIASYWFIERSWQILSLVSISTKSRLVLVFNWRCKLMKTSKTTITLFAALCAIMSGGVVAQPDNATHIPESEIMTVFEHLGETIDQQIRVVDIGDDINVGVGILKRVGNRTEGEEVNAIVHHRVTEIYYILSGSGILVTGGDESNAREFPADNSSVLVLIGPSGSRTVVNGQVQTVKPGDVVVIPAGVPHGFRHIQDQVTYLSMRVDPDQTLPTGYAHPSLSD